MANTEMVKQTYRRGLAGEPGSPTVAHDLCSSTLGASACHGDPVIQWRRGGKKARRAFPG